MRRHTIVGPLRDARGAAGRSRALRDALRREPTAVSLSQAMIDGLRVDAAQLPLWGPPAVLGDVVEQPQKADATVGARDMYPGLHGPGWADDGGGAGGEGPPAGLPRWWGQAVRSRHAVSPGVPASTV